MCLIVGWALVPVWLIIVVAIGLGVSFGAATYGSAFLLFTLPVWSILTLLPFNLVRRVREIYAREPD